MERRAARGSSSWRARGRWPGDPSRADDAARAYRAILADARVGSGAPGGRARGVRVARAVRTPSRRGGAADRRWLLEWRAEHAPEEERIARLLDWAREEETTFGDPVHALALHRRVLALDAESDEALHRGGAPRARDGRHRRGARGPAARGATGPRGRRASPSSSRWRRCSSRGRRGGATRSRRCARSWQRRRATPTARALAAQLLAHRATRADAIAMLEQACDASDDVEARAQILTRLLDAPADADDAAARRGWFERLCDLQRERATSRRRWRRPCGRPARCRTSPRLWDRAEELARTLGRPDEVAALYEEVLARSLGREQALAIGERAVQFYEEWFEDPARVVRILERVLELDPDRRLGVRPPEAPARLGRALGRSLRALRPRPRLGDGQEAREPARGRGADREGLRRPARPRHPVPRAAARAAPRGRRSSRARSSASTSGRAGTASSCRSCPARLPTLKRDEARRTRARVARAVARRAGGRRRRRSRRSSRCSQRPEEGANGSAEDVWALLERVLAAAPPKPEPRRTTRPSARRRRTRRDRGARRKSEPPLVEQGLGAAARRGLAARALRADRARRGPRARCSSSSSRRSSRRRSA